MRTPTFSARVLDAGAALRVPRPALSRVHPAGAGPTRRIALLVLLGLVGLLAVVYLVLRLTPLSAVQRVTVVGAQGPDAPAIRRAIERAAMGQSTLGFGDAAVRRAVAGTTSITGVTVHAKFPHAVQVEVHQRLAVGAVEAGGRRVAVSADGRLLPDWRPGSLPLIRGARSGAGVVLGGARAATTILGAAPAELLAHVARVDGGTTIRLAKGPALLFRDTNRTGAKWAAAVAVLNDPGTRGATWIDLRIPEQPIAGKGAPPTLPSKTARVGKVATTSDALATAEGSAPAADAAATGTAADAPAAEAPATTRAAPVAPSATPQRGAAGAAAPAAGPTSGGAAVPASGAPATTGTASTGATSVPDSGAVAPEAPSSGAATGGPASGGGTAPAGQTAP
jgi:cell division septal protein FtsQ